MFKDRLSAWGVSKNLRDDEVVNLTRIKVSRDAVGKSITFLRYGTLIPPRRLYRRLREKRHLQQKVLKQGSSEADIDDLLQNYLPSRGLVALEPHPSAGLRGDEMLHIIESSIFPLRAFGTSDVRWCFEHMAYSPWLLYVGLFDRDPMAQTEAERKHAWEFIERACYIMRQDISRVPDESALLLLWVMSKDNVAGKQPLLGYQLMRHASQLFASSFGPKHPYSILFAGAASMTYNITSCGCFWSCSREVLINVVKKRLSSGMAEAPYRQMVPEVNRSFFLQRQKFFKIASKLRVIEILLPGFTALTLLLNFVILHQDIKHEEAEAELFRLGSTEISEKSWAETAVLERVRSSSCAEVSHELMQRMSGPWWLH